MAQSREDTVEVFLDRTELLLDSKAYVTQSDAKATEHRLMQAIDGVRIGFGGEIKALDVKIDGVRKDLSAEISSVRADLTAEISSVRTELGQEIKVLDAKVNALDIKVSVLDAKIDSVHLDLSARIDVMQASSKYDMANLKAELMNFQLKVGIAAVGTTVVTLVGAIFGMLKYLPH